MESLLPCIPVQRLAVHLTQISGHQFYWAPNEPAPLLLVYSPGALLPVIERYARALALRVMEPQEAIEIMGPVRVREREVHDNSLIVGGPAKPLLSFCDSIDGSAAGILRAVFFSHALTEVLEIAHKNSPMPAPKPVQNQTGLTIDFGVLLEKIRLREIPLVSQLLDCKNDEGLLRLARAQDGWLDSAAAATAQDRTVDHVAAVVRQGDNG